MQKGSAEENCINLDVIAYSKFIPETTNKTLSKEIPDFGVQQNLVDSATTKL